MTDQLRISDSGQIEDQPLTWDQEPMWSVATVQEGLFERAPFEQLRGQTAFPARDLERMRQDGFKEARAGDPPLAPFDPTLEAAYLAGYAEGQS